LSELKGNLSKYRLILIPSVILLIALVVWWLKNREPYEPEALPAGFHGTYTTEFPNAENPISEGGNWINGKASGRKWANVRTYPGLAFGTQSGKDGYDDSTSILAGPWGPTQTVTATIHVSNPPASSTIFEEVELRLRTRITADKLTGYEVNFSCSANPANFYSEIVRWNGPLGSFTYLSRATYHCVNGDVVKATMSGRRIEVFVNSARIMQATDTAFSTGNPGIGFFLQGIEGEANPDFGFSRFTATDGLITAESPNVGH
jgi:hypothetical protein